MNIVESGFLRIRLYCISLWLFRWEVLWKIGIWIRFCDHRKLKRSARCYNFLLVITHSHSHLFWLERHFCSAMFFFGKEQKSEENALFGFFDNLGCLVPNAKNGLKYSVKYYYVFSFQDNYRSCGYPLLIINCSWILTVLKAMVRIKYWNWPSKSGLKIYKPWLIQMAKTDKSEIIWKISKN